jgi:hypothetical protein
MVLIGGVIAPPYLSVVIGGLSAPQMCSAIHTPSAAVLSAAEYLAQYTRHGSTTRLRLLFGSPSPIHEVAGEMQPEEDSMLTEMDAVALSNKECVVVSVPATNSPETPALGEGATTLQSASGDEVLQSNGMEPPAQEASALVAGQIPPEKMMAEATVVTAPAAEAAEAVGPVNSGSIVAVEVREDEEEAKDRSNAKVHFGRKKAQGFTRLENTDAPPADVHREAPSFRGFWIHLSLPRFYALLPVAIVCGLLIGVNTRRAMVDLLSASAEQALVSGPQ